MKHLGHPPNLDKLIRVLQETALPHYSSRKELMDCPKLSN